MLNGLIGLLLAIVFVAVVLLGGAAMNSLAERLERKLQPRRSEQEPTQDTEKPEEKGRAA